jgi:acetyltransferase-like isoleucine patch superfamily enzyme
MIPFVPVHARRCAFGQAPTIIADTGERAVIGANTVVSRDIAAFCVAVGTPARVIEYMGPPELRHQGLDV